MPLELTPIPGSTPSASAYLSVGQADALAATLPAAMVARYTAATSGQKAAALLMASEEWDQAYVWQGRKFVEDQVREFPRIGYGDMTPAGINQYGWPLPGTAGQIGAGWVIWDWDSSSNSAVVPREVMLAVLFHADYLLTSGSGREQRLQAMADGVTDRGVGSMKESYAPGAKPVRLCARADQYASKYWAKQGRLL